MFICEICKKKAATVHITEVVEQREFHLCADCAKNHPAAANKEALNLFAKVALKREDGPEEVGPVCEMCGLSFQAFQKRGRLGCAEDYTVFRKDLTPIIERIHGRLRHNGKRWRMGTEEDAARRDLANLNLRLREAINTEAYEDAAAIRDEIRLIQNGPTEE